MRLIENSFSVQKIDIAELNKLVKREIENDCRAYVEKLVNEIIEESWSTRRLKREMSKGTKLMTGIEDTNGKIVTGRGKIIQVITEFFTELYDDKEDMQDNKLEEPVGGEETSNNHDHDCSDLGYTNINESNEEIRNRKGGKIPQNGQGRRSQRY